ncbi:MAG: hypothetical protein LBU14_01950 [Candidatus Peribacteria bacterium]|nr:hypothetical protein [Candidatus Peribacteria bacterium]
MSVLFLILNLGNVYGAITELTTFKVVDKNTFNEYKYKITEQYIDLKSEFNVEKRIDENIARNILTLAEAGLKYLPDDLINKNYFSSLESAIKN